MYHTLWPYFPFYVLSSAYHWAAFLPHTCSSIATQNLESTNKRKYDTYPFVSGLFCLIRCPPIACIFLQMALFLFSLRLNTPLCNYFVPFQRRHAVSISGFPVAALIMHLPRFYLLCSLLSCLWSVLFILCPVVTAAVNVVTAAVNGDVIGSLLCDGHGASLRISFRSPYPQQC